MPFKGSLLAYHFLPQVSYLPNNPFTLWTLDGNGD